MKHTLGPQRGFVGTVEGLGSGFRVRAFGIVCRGLADQNRFLRCITLYLFRTLSTL